MSEDIQQIDAALRAYRDGDAMPFAELVASKFAVECRSLVVATIVSPPKPQRPPSPRLVRLAKATREVRDLICNGVHPREAMKNVLGRYPGIKESVLDNAALGKVRGDVDALIRASYETEPSN